MKDDKTIDSVVKDGLCTGCGTCISLCPQNAIELTINQARGIYVPQLVEEKCDYCGICFDVCPGHSVDFKLLNSEIFGKQPDDSLLGNYLNCYTGYATDYDIRYNSASGGLVTALLIFALEQEMIDGALVTRMKKDKPLEPEPFIARTREEIISAAKSKYCPVPANIALKEILNAKEGERFAVVGLPCHLHGIRKTEQTNKILRERIVLHLGILCSINRNFLAQDYLFKKFGVRKKEVVKLDYRGEGWIGGMTVTIRDGSRKFYPLSFYWARLLGMYFIPWRCTLCSDQSGELSDASFGDIWLPEFRSDRIGTSVIICRTDSGDKILRQMVSRDIISLSKVETCKVIESQSNPMRIKKVLLGKRLALLRRFGRKTPLYNQDLGAAGVGAYAYAVSLYFQIWLSSKRYFWWLLGPFRTLMQVVLRIIRTVR